MSKTPSNSNVSPVRGTLGRPKAATVKISHDYTIFYYHVQQAEATGLQDAKSFAFAIKCFSRVFKTTSHRPSRLQPGAIDFQSLSVLVFLFFVVQWSDLATSRRKKAEQLVQKGMVNRSGPLNPTINPQVALQVLDMNHDDHDAMKL